MNPKSFEVIVEFTPQNTKTGITYEAHQKGSLIRCKDCKYYRPFITEPDVFHYCWLWSKRFKEDEYCARAEPKEKE